jgi:diadenosine tetraphosphate (Ap4A) HIT family hydrolase
MNNECPFCADLDDRIAFHGDLVLGLWDKFPVSPGHLLIVPRRHVAGWFEATADEQSAITSAIETARRIIEDKHSPVGYNIGMNLGEAAGQTVFHLHLHVIPRYQGDSDDPRGGIRLLMPDKAAYWEDGD